MRQGIIEKNVKDLGNKSGAATINYSTDSASIYTVTATAAITGWTFSNFPTNAPFEVHVTGNYDIAYGTDGTGSTANQDGLKVFVVRYDGANYQMTWDNAQGGGTLSSVTISTSLNLDYATASELVSTDGSKNLVSLPVATYPSLTELSYVKGVTSAVQTQIAAKQNKASTRYAKGNISGAVSIDYANGDYQVCTTTATVTGITISNLATETGMILLIDNSGGYSVTFGSTEIIATTDTGVYACAFYNDNGTVYFYGRGERQS